ncbi:IclR family transcriptional regulator [Nocardioides taihuensis]|uniref:IclR family transcriptional regulator n=1 Tax=Nocardioides taihuensis TaxID=1835606 RepID=A0ABW0BGS1_9ACTN
MPDPAASGTQAVDRAALLVSTVVLAAEPLASAELAEETGLPRSTTSRLLTALERTELLQRDDSGSYVAGPLFWLYASRHDPWAEIARLARPVMEEIGEETGETVNLGMARANRVVHVAQVDSRFLLGTRDWTELDVPPHASALGKVLYAAGVLPLPRRRPERVTERTLADLDALRRELVGVRERGWAATVDELEVGLTGVAVPVHGDRGEVVAALGVSGPTQRLAGRLEPTGALLADAAGQLSDLLGGSPRTRPETTRKEGVA